MQQANALAGPNTITRRSALLAEGTEILAVHVSLCTDDPATFMHCETMFWLTSDSVLPVIKILPTESIIEFSDGGLQTGVHSSGNRFCWTWHFRKIVRGSNKMICVAMHTFLADEVTGVVGVKYREP